MTKLSAAGVKTKIIQKILKVKRINDKFSNADAIALANKYPDQIVLGDKKKRRRTNRFTAAANR